MPSWRLAFLGGVVCGAAAADAPLDPGAVRQALATVALGAFVLGACCACAGSSAASTLPRGSAATPSTRSGP